MARAGAELGVLSQTVPEIPSIEPITQRQDAQIALLQEQNSFLKTIVNSVKGGITAVVDVNTLGDAIGMRSERIVNQKILLQGAL